MSESSRSLSQRFFGLCVLLLGGIVAIWLALELLARIWGWIALIVTVLLVVFLAWKLYQHRSSRW